MATITVTDNFYSEFAERNTEGKPNYSYKGGHEFFKSSANMKLETFIDGKVWSNLENCHLYSLKGEQSVIDDNELILSIHEMVDSEKKLYWRVKSGNFVGSFQYQGHSIELKSRFSDAFLQRMLGVINNVHLSVFDGQEASKRDYTEFLLHYLFVQKLESAFLLGFPKSYVKQRHHRASVKGKVDISNLIKKDTPYIGKVASVARQRVVDEAILSVLNKTLKIVFNRSKSIAQNVRHVYNAVQQLNPKGYKRETLNQAKVSRSLSNPLFKPFKEVLDLAELIIAQQSLKPSKNNENSSFGFLVNVAELFELYVKSLLQKSFVDWNVYSPEIRLYEKSFFFRKIIPDIVMQLDGRVIVFDTKYKRMLFRGTKEQFWDVDRSDFFQIHTYMSYYDSHPDFHLIGGGLLYPLSDEINTAICHSEKVLNKPSNSWFVIDGIEVPSISVLADGGTMDKIDSESTFEALRQSEYQFINRVNQIIESNQSELV